MAQAKLSVYQKSLKYFHGPRMAEAVANKVVWLKKCKDASDQVKFGGRDATMIFPVHTKGNWGTGASPAEGGDTGTPRVHGWDEYSVGLADLDVNFEISHKLIQATKSRPELAYVGSALEYEMKQTMETAEKLLGIQIWGDGSGALCQVNTGTGGGAITGTTFFVNNPSAVHLQIGQFLSAHANNTTGDPEKFTAGVQEILDIDPATGQVTVTDTTGLANTHYLFLAGHYGAVNMTGMRALIDDGTVAPVFQGLTRSAKRYTKSHVVTNTGSLNEQAILAVYRRLYLYAPSKEVASDVVCDAESQEILALNIIDRQRFTDSGIEGGYSTVNFATPYGKRKITIDPLAPPYQMWFCNFSDFGFGWMGQKGGDWLHEDVLAPKVSSSSGTGYAKAYVATWQMYVQMVNYNPPNQALLQGYTA